MSHTLPTTASNRLPVPATRWRRRGVSMVELLIALAIAASLLTATAVAIQASFDTYQANQEHATGMQRARLALNRILAQIRTTQSHQPLSTAACRDFVKGTVTTDTGITMFTDDTSGVTFQLVEGQLLHTPFSIVDGAVSNGTSHVLLSDVQQFTVTFESQASADSIRQYGYGVYDQLRRATITLTVRAPASLDSTGKQSITLSASVMPRRNLY